MHTDESSSCSHAPAADSVELYINAGYNSIVITDHFQFDTDGVTESEYFKKADILSRGFEHAQNAASGRINVLRGAEIRLKNCSNDYLVYGITENFIRQNPDIRSMEIKQLCELVHSSGLMIFQAHPFRVNMTITDPDILDGVEVYNGNKKHYSRNSISLAWAQLHSLKEVSGSDYHQLTDVQSGGIYTDEPITDNAKLLEILKNGNYRLK